MFCTPVRLRLAAALVVALLQGLPAFAIPVIVDSTDTAARAALVARGATTLAERGSLVVVDSPNGAAGIAHAVERPDFESIRLRRGPVDPTRRAARRAPTRRLRLVQFAAPPTDSDRAALEASGLRIVHYVPQNAFLVWTDVQKDTGPKARRAVVRLRHEGDFEPQDAIAPSLDAARSKDTFVEVTIQLVADTDQTDADVRRAEALAQRVLQPARRGAGGTYIHLGLRLATARLEQLAALDTIVNIEPRVAPQRHDERQGQVMAGNLSPDQSDPSQPGYLGFLAGLGFSTDPLDYPIVAIVDDGVDDGTTLPPTPDFYELGDDANPSRIAFSVLPPGATASGPEGPDGHGTINASIAGGYNDAVGASFEDAEGFNYGLGISPYGRLASVRVFSPNFDAGTSEPVMVDDYYTRGARISSNSWGADVAGAYNSSSQEYDALTRDARASLAGNQQLLFLFSAGNEGPTSGSIGSPGTAKNVLTVGASETSNPAASVGSGCGDVAADGNDARDMSSFSSRGPCDDLRMKPDLVAPGTFIHGSASQPDFNGSGVCGPTGNNFTAPGTDALFPPGTNYTWSSGTSHSTPGVAGYASLAFEFLAREYGISAPSPALAKAFLIHATRHLTGNLANEDLPGRHQGFGMVDLDLAFDSGATRQFIDQTHLFTGPGQTFEWVGQVVDPQRPVRFVLAWTDAPGPTVGDAFVNDLDLEAEVGLVDYRGNNFDGGLSQAGGNPDTRNNVEAIFLPAGADGLVRLTVRATGVAGDGVPGNGDPSDQDFALVAHNFVTASPAGAVFFDRQVYNCSGTLRPVVLDADLAGDGGAAVTLSATGGDTELVSAAETPVNSGIFEASVPLQSGGAAVDGVLQVAHGATITATYDDADDGSGQPATAQDTASIDCIAPAVSSITTSSINGSGATIQLATDEPAQTRIRYGTSCATLTGQANGSSGLTVHGVALAGLMPLTTYFFTVEASDPAGNLTLDDNGGLCHSFTTTDRVDGFSEQFAGTFDLQFKTLSFLPATSTAGYTLCVADATTFPTDPAGGIELTLSDDDSEAIELTGGAEVEIHGERRSTVYVGSNGYVTFESDTDFSESFTDHFTRRRVAALFDDLNPSAGGIVSYRQLTDRLAVTYAGVPEFLDTGSNSFQIELFFDGRIQITYLAISGLDAIAGLSNGAGLAADFAPSDLSASEVCTQSAGTIDLDAALYGCSDSIGVSVFDGDLAGVGAVAVEIETDSGDLETLTLAETGVDTASFTGVLAVARTAIVADDGILQLDGGDAITARYFDADDGSGASRTVAETAHALCVDPFAFYQTARNSAGPSFASFAPLTLTDRFRSVAYKVLKPERSGLPARLDDDTVDDPQTYLREYRIKEDKGVSKFDGVPYLRVDSRCGSLYLSLQRPTSLMLPAAQSAAAPVAAPVESLHELDHYLCYKAQTQTRLANGTRVAGVGEGFQVDVVDDFDGTAARRYDLTKVTKLCVPAATSGTPTYQSGPDKGAAKPVSLAAVRHPNDNLLCYAARLAKQFRPQNGCAAADPDAAGTTIVPKQPKHAPIAALHSTDAFGALIGKTSKEKEVCLPVRIP